MLNQSILLNLKIGWKNFQIAFGIALALLTLSLMPAFGINTLLQLAALIAPLYLIYKGLYDIFGASIYGSGSVLYMTLPFAPREIVLGKVFAASIFLFLYDLMFIIMTGLSAVIGDSLSELILILLKEDMPIVLAQMGEGSAVPLSVGAGLYPLFSFVSRMFTSALLFMLLLRFNRNGSGRKNTVAWVLFFGLTFILNRGSDKLLTAILMQGSAMFLIAEIVVIALYAGAAALFMDICIRTLKYDYNV